MIQYCMSVSQNAVDLYVSRSVNNVMQSKKMKLWIYMISGIIQSPVFSDS